MTVPHEGICKRLDKKGDIPIRNRQQEFIELKERETIFCGWEILKSNAMLTNIRRANACTSHLPSPSTPLKNEGLERFGSYHHVFIFLKALKRVLQKL